MTEEHKPEQQPQAEQLQAGTYGPFPREATATVSKDGGFAKFAQNRAVQLAGAGLLGIFIGGGAVATGVAVAGDGGDRSSFTRQWHPSENDGPGGPGGRFTPGNGTVP